MKIAKKRLLLTGIIFLAILVIFFIPFFPLSFGATNATFTVTLTIGNNPPNITWVQSGVSETPNIGTNKTIWIAFNATDPDGYQNLNNNSAKINLTFGGEESRYSSSCTAVSAAGNTTQYNCSITIWYYDLAASWQINASIYDINNAFANDTSTTMNIGTLTAVIINKSSMSFTANLGQTNLPSNDNPLTIDNVGNENITVINLTAYDLNKSTEVIEASNFKANSTDNSTLHNLINNTRVNLVNVAVPRDLPAFAENESLYLYVDVPGSGLTAGEFQSMANWVIDVS